MPPAIVTLRPLGAQEQRDHQEYLYKGLARLQAVATDSPAEIVRTLRAHLDERRQWAAQQPEDD